MTVNSNPLWMSAPILYECQLQSSMTVSSKPLWLSAPNLYDCQFQTSMTVSSKAIWLSAPNLCDCQLQTSMICKYAYSSVMIPRVVTRNRTYQCSAVWMLLYIMFLVNISDVVLPQCDGCTVYRYSFYIGQRNTSNSVNIDKQASEYR